MSARFPVHLLRERVNHRRRNQELLVAVGVVLLRRATRAAPERGGFLIVEDAGGQYLGLVKRSARHGADGRGGQRAAALNVRKGEADAESL